MLTALSSILVGLLLVFQGIFIYLYFININDNHFRNLSQAKSRSLKLFLNLSIFMAGMGLSAIIHYMTSMIGMTGSLGNVLFVIICSAICIYCWYLLPGYVNTDSISESIRSTDLVSSLILFILGLIVGKYTFDLFNLLPKSIAPIFYLLLLQSIFGILTYYMGDKGRPLYLSVFITLGIISLLVLVISMVYIFAFQRSKVTRIDTKKSVYDNY